MEKKGVLLVIAPDVMQKYFEGSPESKMDEVIEKCRKFPDKIRMTTPTSAFIRALKESFSIDGVRVKKFLQTCELADVSKIKKKMGG